MIDQSEGYALLSTLSLLVVSVIFATVYLKWVGIGTTSVERFKEKTQLEAFAESAVNDAINKWEDKSYWRAKGTDTSPFWKVRYRDLRYRVETKVLRHPDKMKFEAVTRYKGSRTSGHRSALLRSVLPFALVANDEVRITGNARITDPILGRSDVIVGRPAVVSGNVLTEGISGGSGDYQGQQFNKLDLSEYIFPGLETYDLQEFQTIQKNRLSGEQFRQETLFRNGNLTLQNVHLDETALFVDGDLTILEYHQQTSQTNLPALYVTGTLNINADGGKIRGLVAVENQFAVNGDFVLKGSVFAESIRIQGDILASNSFELLNNIPTGFEPRTIKGPWKPIRYAE